MSDSYYGRPIVKPHVWTPYIPCYFWVGGTAGAAAVHAALARLRGEPRTADIQSRVALAGALISPVLLIADLGVPARFAHMLRVFKPTSPMSMGTYILITFSAAIGSSNLARVLGWRTAARGAELAAAALGPLLTTYTAVLIADTATPVWREASGSLPFLFVASGIAGAGALGCAFGAPEETLTSRRLMIGGAVALVVVGRIMEQQLGPLLREPYRTGRAGTLKRLAGAFGLAGALVGSLSTKHLGWTRVAAAAVVAAGVTERFMIFAAGTQSARDPRYVVEPQRARLDANGGRPSSLSPR